MRASGSEGERASDSAGTSGDEAETAVVGQPAPIGAPAMPGGVSIGRYVVLEEVGRGGMGRVLRAYDPKLQREVALKELRGDLLGEVASKRLVAEARAMAKLSHPNVVGVFDVEEVEGDRLVLVMEYVPGATLRTWLRERERPWQEVVQRFVEAGRGLAAAHAVGLLHRDFKPANVLVHDSGVVKVTDFGLAKGTGEESSSLRASSEGEDDSGKLTQSGVVLGTPRYMAPEQHRPSRDRSGRQSSLTAAADQYALCVALWEALCVKPPFSGPGIARHKRDGPPAWPNPGVPRTIADALVRGLAPNPADRWPSLEALLTVLSADPSRQRNRWLAVFGGVAVVGLLGVGWQSWLAARGAQCSGADAQLAGAWDGDRRAEARASIFEVGVPYADEVWERTQGELDRYADAWASMHTDACEATTLRGEQSAQVMDLQMGCLHRARVELAAAADVFANADADVVERAHELVGGLPPLSRCADVEALRADVEPPLPQDAEAVEEIRRRLARARAETEAGRYSRTQQELEVARGRLAGVEYGPVRAELALAEGGVLDRLGQYEAAESALLEALHEASRWHQVDEMLHAATKLMFVVGYQRQRPDDALRYWELAKGLAKGDRRGEQEVRNVTANLWAVQGRFEEAEAAYRQVVTSREETHGPEDPSVAGFRSNLALVLLSQGKYEEAGAEHRRALATREKALGPMHPSVAASHNNLGLVLIRQARYEEAEAEHRRALAIEEKAVGPEHPDVATSRNNLANALDMQGRHEEAEKEQRRALALREKALGLDHPVVAESRNNLGLVLQMQGRHEEAEAEHRTALAIQEKALGPEHLSTATSLNNLANVLFAQEQYEEAEAEHRRALALRETSLGPAHPSVAQSRHNLAGTLFEQERYAEAEEENRRSLATLEKTLGPDHPNVAGSRSRLAQALLKLERPHEALEVAQRAWARHQRDDILPQQRAETAFVLARVRWETSAEEDHRAAARALARRAVADYRAGGDAFSGDVATVRAWLSTRGGR